MKYLLSILSLAFCVSVLAQEDPNHELRKQKMEQKHGYERIRTNA